MKTEITTTAKLVKALTDRRKKLEISQTELAQLCNLSTNGISKFESNGGEREIKLSTLLKLGQVLGFKIVLEFED